MFFLEQDGPASALAQGATADRIGAPHVRSRFERGDMLETLQLMLVTAVCRSYALLDIGQESSNSAIDGRLTGCTPVVTPLTG